MKLQGVWGLSVPGSWLSPLIDPSMMAKNPKTESRLGGSEGQESCG